METFILKTRRYFSDVMEDEANARLNLLRTEGRSAGHDEGVTTRSEKEEEDTGLVGFLGFEWGDDGAWLFKQQYILNIQRSVRLSE